MESTPGKRLLEWREYKGLTLLEMARITGVSKTTINGAEQSGSSNPSYDTIIKVLSGFPDLNPDWLLLGTGPMLRDGRTLTPTPPTDTTPSVKTEPDTTPAALAASRGGLPTPGEATPQQADFVGKLIQRLETELAGYQEREVWYQDMLKKPSPAPDATWLPAPAATPISMRPAACITTTSQVGGKVLAMWPTVVAARAQA